MGIRDASGKEKIVILFNGVVRFAQLVVAVAALGVYGTQKGYWLDHGLPGKIGFELAVASLALITAILFGILPFVLSYRPVALAFAWDLIMMALWGAAFGLMKGLFLRYYSRDTDDRFEVTNTGKDDEIFADHWNTMERSAYINLAGLALFLISGIMGLVLFFIGRKSSRLGAGKVNHV